MSENRHAKVGIHHADAEHQHHLKHGVILRRAKLTSMAIVILLLVGAGVTVAARVLHDKNMQGTTEQNARVYVSTLHAEGNAKAETITLPSTMQGMIEAPIYARSTGYVVRWSKDIGSSVTKNEVLAVIDTPEVDQQLAQAVATRAQQASSMELAKTTAARWEELRKKDAVTQQDLNEKQSAYTQAVANLAAADADMKRLKKLEEFKQVLAPFSGVITQRNVEVGDLVAAGNGNGGTGRALFTLADVNPIRMYVYVPQADAQRIKVGDTVSVALTEHPEQPVQGKIKHIAGAMDVTTRTLQVEVNVPNGDNKLLAGSYAQVTLPINGTSGILRVPTNVLLFRPEGTQIAVVGSDGRVKLHTVKVGRDLGKTLEILDGITAQDNLINNPPDSLAENDVVTVQNDTNSNTETAGKAHS